MTTIQLKNKLLDKIDKINDSNVISELNEVIDSYFLTERIVLSNNHKAAIEEGIADIKQGNYLTEQEANREVEEWLKK